MFLTILKYICIHVAKLEVILVLPSRTKTVKKTQGLKSDHSIVLTCKCTF